MPKIKKYSDKGDKAASVWSKDDSKRYGFVTQDRIPDERLPETRYTTRYGVGIDNLPGDNDYYKELKTLLGTLDFGKEGDTGFIGYTPDMTRTTWERAAGDGNGMVSQDYLTQLIGENAGLQAGRYGNSVDGNTYFANAWLPGDKQYIPDFNGGINTPLGRLGLETNGEDINNVEANFKPNYYVQALVNLLRGNR